MPQYAAERKESVVRRMLALPERSIREWSQDTGISVRSLYDWRRKAVPEGSSVAGQSQPSGRQAAGAKRTSAQKIAIVAETAIRNEAERAEYCCAHGVDPEEGKAWREAAESALAGGMVPAKAFREARAAQARRMKELEHELRRKERALAEAAALLTLRKKAHAILREGEDA